MGGLMPRSTSQNFCCQCPYPHGETQPPPTSAGDPPTLAVHWVQARTTILQPVEQNPHTQKDRKDEKEEGYVSDEGTR